MKKLPKLLRKTFISLGLCASFIAGPVYADVLELNFNYRLTPAAGDLGITVATARFEDVITSAGFNGIDLTLTNVGSDNVPGIGATSYISGLLLAFNYEDAQLPNIIVEQFTDDAAHSDRWEPQEDVATVDGFTFTSELGFPKGTSNANQQVSKDSLRQGETAHVQFWWDTGLAGGDITVASLVEAVRGASVNNSIPDIFAVVKVRSFGAITGGEDIESVPTIVVGALTPAAVPVPAALPLFLSALAGSGFIQRKRNRSV